MDFALSLLISGIVASVLLIFAIIIYFRRFREIEGQLTEGTRRALLSFGLSVVFLVLVPISGILLPTIIPVWISALVVGLIVSEMYLAMDDVEKVKKYGTFLGVLVLVVGFETVLRILIPSYPLPPIALIMVLPPSLITAIIGTLYVLRESPSPFTGSMLIIIVFTIFAGMSATIGDLLVTPQYFIIQILPVVVAAGVLGSMLRPWRNIVTLSLASLIVCVGIALSIPALLEGEAVIYLLTIPVTFALLCLLSPLSFFLKQTVETRATTALYISLTLVSMALLALTHVNNYAISYSSLGVWDEGILFIDWFFGVLAVSAFTMSAIATSFSANVRHASREVIIGFGMMLLTLGMPFVRWVEVDGEMIQRWELDPLYLGIFALVIISFMVFFKMAYQLWKAGSGRAGLRFIFFMFATLFLGIVSMFADNIPIDLLMPLELAAGVMMLLSSPRRNPFAQG